MSLAATALAQTATGPAPASAEDLMKQVLAALEAKDQTALERFTITEAEYRKFVWPNMAARSSGGSAEKSWTMYQKANVVGITTNLNEIGGHKLHFVKVAF